ncbi:MAG: Crp/Fnr family transcriptional regulator [Sphingobacteriia bacterium]|nr:MAG: Crp/Fnr family transcriptional regulator [Sphingobacteriia bacterium]
MELNPIFQQLFEPALLQEMQQFGEWHAFAEGDLIMDYGKYIRSMPLIVKGTIKVMRKDETGKEILLYYLSAAESCSMAYTCCLEAKKSEVKAIAEDAVEIIGLPQVKLNDWICQYPSWKNYIFRSFNERFLELLQAVETIAFQRLDERLWMYLLEKKRISGSPLLHVSHAQIADELASSRVVISRLLKALENQGKLLLYRNEIRLMKGFD